MGCQWDVYILKESELAGLQDRHLQLLNMVRADPSECPAKGLLCSQELDLAKRQGRHGHMLQLIEQAKTEELFTAEGLLQLSYLCRDAPSAHLPAAKAALSAALQRMRSQKEPPPMDTFAEVIHFCLSSIMPQPCAMEELSLLKRAVRSGYFQKCTDV